MTARNVERSGAGRRLRALMLAGFAFVASVVSASAETLLMPKRDFLMGANEVVWGITTQPLTTAFTLDYGDGTPAQTGTITTTAFRSYIAFNHVYANSGPYTVTLTVGGETATVQVNVHNAVLLSEFDLRGLNINRAIQDGLRYLWQSQSNRANFDTTAVTNWGGSFPNSHTALVVLAFENHGYVLPNGNGAPTGLYEKYVVQRGLNHVFDTIRTLSLTTQPAGNPCVGPGIEAAPCVGLQETSDPGYATAVAALPIAASGALSRTVQAGLGAGQSPANYVVGRTYGEILQRLLNAVAFGQNDGVAPGGGGWIYQFSNNANQQSDGSTVGWDLLALLDSTAAGTTQSGFVKTEFQTKALPGGLNTNGSYDYRADNAPASPNSQSVGKAGIGVQGLFYTGQPLGNAQVQAGITYISNNWINNVNGNLACGGGHNKGCAYDMFNVFKALKLYGVQTLPGVTRPAGPGAIPAGDWYADYVDFLVSTQTSPTSVTGGSWNNLGFSCCNTSVPASAALAELILAPVALIQPDPGLFSTVGLTPFTDTNPPGTSHTVTATAQSTGGAPIPGATINFVVLTGPNAGKTGSGVSDSQGQVTFTYQDTSTPPYPKTDTIQASIGALNSNIVSKTWAIAVSRCDVDANNVVNQLDLNAIRNANGQPASGPTDARDGNGDGFINVADVRFCQLRLGPVPQ